MKLNVLQDNRYADVERVIVQLPTAQLAKEGSTQMPAFLSITTFTNHLEIINRCKSYEERVFYMLYTPQQYLKSEELRSVSKVCLVKMVADGKQN